MDEVLAFPAHTTKAFCPAWGTVGGCLLESPGEQASSELGGESGGEQVERNELGHVLRSCPISRICPLGSDEEEACVREPRLCSNSSRRKE